VCSADSAPVALLPPPRAPNGQQKKQPWLFLSHRRPPLSGRFVGATLQGSLRSSLPSSFGQRRGSEIPGRACYGTVCVRLGTAPFDCDTHQPVR
jgi:hypothetical protein